MEEYDNDAEELETNFVKNQEKEKMEFEEDLEESIQSKVRPTSKLLNMKYRIEQLSKYQRFEEAAKLQNKYNIEVGLYAREHVLFRRLGDGPCFAYFLNFYICIVMCLKNKTNLTQSTRNALRRHR
jgi:hypothetical protein